MWLCGVLALQLIVLYVRVYVYKCRCLQDNKHKKDFSKVCKQEVDDYEHEASSDYRLNFRLSNSCKDDISALCSSVCVSDEGQVRDGVRGHGCLHWFCILPALVVH